LCIAQKDTFKAQLTGVIDMSILQSLQTSITPLIAKQKEAGELQRAYVKTSITRSTETLSIIADDTKNYFTELTASDSFVAAFKTQLAFQDNIRATVITATKANVSATKSLWEEMKPLFTMNREIAAPATETV
jgi:hypothetical protein